MEFRDAIRRRRMVRKFEQKPIPDEMLTRVLEVARHAPSGVLARVLISSFSPSLRSWSGSIELRMIRPTLSRFLDESPTWPQLA